MEQCQFHLPHGRELTKSLLNCKMKQSEIVRIIRSRLDEISPIHGMMFDNSECIKLEEFLRQNNISCESFTIDDLGSYFKSR